MKSLRVGTQSYPLEGGWWSPPARRLHLALAIGLPACLAAGWFELSRALAGHEIAWVYAGEWPLYGVLGTYMWWKLLHSEVADMPEKGSEGPRPPGTTNGEEVLSAAEDPTAEDQRVDAPDPGLEAWQDYLERLHAVDPPGQPPART